MKKLNITKEQFNRSRYFKNKYGELEYVSESGKLFKTNKSKILMFKESASADFVKFCEELKTKFSTIDGVKIYLMDNEDGSNTITVSIRRFDDARSVWYPEDVKKIGQFIKRKCDRFGWSVDKNVEYRLGITDFYITEIESSDDVVKESTKKFGRKFKESIDDEKKQAKLKLIRAYDTMEEALREYSGNLDPIGSKKASKAERKIHEILIELIDSTR